MRGSGIGLWLALAVLARRSFSVLDENLDFVFGDAEYELKTREDVEKFLKDAEQVYILAYSPLD